MAPDVGQPSDHHRSSKDESIPEAALDWTRPEPPEKKHLKRENGPSRLTNETGPRGRVQKTNDIVFQKKVYF